MEGRFGCWINPGLGGVGMSRLRSRSPIPFGKLRGLEARIPDPDPTLKFHVLTLSPRPHSGLSDKRGQNNRTPEDRTFLSNCEHCRT